MTCRGIHAFVALALSAVTSCVTLPGQAPQTSGAGGPDSVAAYPQENAETSVYKLPNIGPGVRPALTSDEAGLWMMVDRVEDKLKTSGTRVLDPKLNAYVRDIVCKLAGPYCSDIRVYIMRVPAFNASMMPNGVMQVWTGLLLRSRNEAQLAAVLGHEIGHYLRRHSLQRMREAQAMSDFLIFFDLAVAYAGLPSVSNLAHLLAYGSLAAFSRDNEREADQFGHQFLVENNYDPREAAKVWDQLVREEKEDDDAFSRSVFFATHPPPVERSETLMRLAARTIKDGRPGDTGRQRFLEVMLPHRDSFLRDDLRLGRYSRTLKLLQMLLEDGENMAELKYFEGEVYRLRQKKGDNEKSLEAYRAALEVGNPPPEIHRSLGMVYSKLNESDKAKASFLRYLELKPDAPDQMMIRHLIGKTS